MTRTIAPRWILGACGVLAATLVLSTWTTLRATPAHAGPALAHMVFFTMADDTPANREKLVNACLKYLAKHDGALYFSVGTIVDELDRDVNDRDFDVTLHLVFDSKESHDKYQEHARHLSFIEENKALWSKVRVFDSYLANSPAAVE